MSSESLICARGITKTYPGKKHPLATLKQALFGTSKNTEDSNPVLRGIDVEVYCGETVGIMGRNGAGKTTLLGILGKVIEPSGGTIIRRGRIATLLGLTAGFNANFSGRENAYLFCSIQGLTRKQTDERIDLIHDFSELDRYFDMPLRTYSSGMQARLAFSCAIQVDAALIIVDETLAVGDANFKMKCYERINQMKQEGQTFLLVSHSQNLVASFCSRAIVLEGGVKAFDGPVLEGVDVYKRIRLEHQDSGSAAFGKKTSRNKTSLEEGVAFRDFHYEEQKSTGGVKIGVISATIAVPFEIAKPCINFGIRTHEGIVVASYDGASAPPLSAMFAGEVRKLSLRFENRLMPGRYFISAVLYDQKGDVAKPLAFQKSFGIDVFGERNGGGFVNLNMAIN